MSQQPNPKVIGGFVLGALLLLVAAILFFSSGRYFERTTELVTYFPGTVQGLSIGARVEFQGVQVGEVKDIQLNFWRKDKRFAIPVYYDIWPERIHVFGDDAQKELSLKDRSALYQNLLDKGLRARLESVSMVTGQYMITLSLYPESEYELVGGVSDRLEVPAVAAMRDKLGDMLSGLRLKDLVNSAIDALDAIRGLVEDPALRQAVESADSAVKKLDGLLAELTESVGPMRDDLDTTLKDFSELATSARGDVSAVSGKLQSASARIEQLAADVDAQVDPIANSAKKTLDSAASLIDEDSKARYNLNLMLEEAAGAARSLRMLADYLEQNPDALIKGKY